MTTKIDKVFWEVDNGGCNEGNFIQLVQFCAETDTILADYFSKAPKNAHYMSKTIQNELIAVTGNKIRSHILNEVRSAKFYSNTADEVTDTVNNEELSLVIRYVHDGEIRDVFIDFLEVEQITGRVLCEAF